MEPTDLNTRVRELEAEVERLRAEAEGFRKEAGGALRQLAFIAERQRELLEDTRATAAAVAAIKSSVSWRLLQTWWRVRRSLRGPRMRLRGWSPRARLRRRRPIARLVHQAPLGVNVAGYLSTESGMGEAARASIRSIDAAGIPRALNNVDSYLRKQDTAYTDFTTANPHPFNLVHLNADNMADFWRRRGRAYFRDRYTIGYWFWELSAFRTDWLDAFDHVDEVWVASEFGRRCLEPVSPVPIVKMSLPVTAPEARAVGRAHFNLPEGPRVFLFMFDVSSQIERKNPRAVLRAFRQADLAHDQAVLVLKFTNSGHDPDAVRLLRHEAEGLNVVMMDGYMDRADLGALLNVADCYVSLHRAEGYGLTMAEAMLLGKPVIATAYSGNMEFMTPETAFLVDYKEVPLLRDYGPYLRGSVWADPDVAHAGRLMRDVVKKRDRAAAVGARAAAYVAEHHHPARTGQAVRRRLEAIRSGAAAHGAAPATQERAR